MPTPNGYSLNQIRLHWVVAALIAMQYLIGESIAHAFAARADGTDSGFDPLVPLHVFGGLAILLLAVWRIMLRITRGVPAPPASESAKLRRLSAASHGLLYLLMIVMPVSGAMAWFGDAGVAAVVHNVSKVLLLLLVVLHIVGALAHQFVLRTGLMARMVRAEP